MDSLFELYYRSEEDYTKKQNIVLPYAVNCEELKRIVLLTAPLKEAGFTPVPTGTGVPNRMTTFLINLDFRRYHKMPYPVHASCVDDRVFTIEGFLKEIFEPWKKHNL